MIEEQTTMKIHVSQVPQKGVTERISYDPSSLDMDRDDVSIREPFDVEAAIANVGGQLVVRAAIRASLTMTCARCLTEFTVAVTPKGTFSYTVGPNDVVDITNDVRQEIILAYPIVPHCRPDCKGLCATCGQNLNEKTCGHSAVEPA